MNCAKFLRVWIIKNYSKITSSIQSPKLEILAFDNPAHPESSQSTKTIISNSDRTLELDSHSPQSLSLSNLVWTISILSSLVASLLHAPLNTRWDLTKAKTSTPISRQEKRCRPPVILRWNSGSWSGLWLCPHGWPSAHPSPLVHLKFPFVPAAQDSSPFPGCARIHQSLWGRMTSFLKDSSAFPLANSYLTFQCHFECPLSMEGFSPFPSPGSSVHQRLCSHSMFRICTRITSVWVLSVCCPLPSESMSSPKTWTTYYS